MINCYWTNIKTRKAIKGFYFQNRFQFHRLERAIGSDHIVTMDFNPWTEREKEIEFQRNGTYAFDVRAS